VAFCSKKENKCWIWKATTTLAGTTRLVDVAVGNRSAGTLKPLYERVEKRFPGVFYASDDFGPYFAVLPQNRHAVGKDLTFTIEQHNSDTRHWLARFRRKSKVVSKSLEMIYLSLIAVEYVHKGGGLEKLLQLISI
jgi:insertion element IS1 protein InsB